MPTFAKGREQFLERYLRSRLPPSQPLKTRIHDDTVEPRRNPGALVEAADCANGAHERLLDGVVRLSLTDEAPRDGEHAGAMAAHQDLVGTVIAPPEPLDESRLVL